MIYIIETIKFLKLHKHEFLLKYSFENTKEFFIFYVKHYFVIKLTLKIKSFVIIVIVVLMSC